MKYKKLILEIKNEHKNIYNHSIQNINRFLTVRNLMIGYYIAEYEQNGTDRAVYGKELLKNLAKDLNKYKKLGFSVRNLAQFRKFFFIYPIVQTLSAQLADKNTFLSLILCTDMEIFFAQGTKNKNISRDLDNSKYIKYLFSSLSWSHFVELININDELKRSFYEIECIKNNWSVRELIRQKNSMLFERVGLSKNKEEVLQIARKGMLVKTADDVLKDPYIFEFLGIKENEKYTENQLETALISHLQEFLFEMGKGFCFVARQYRISFNNDHYYIDLLLYNRLIKSLVLIDLKIRDFKPEDAGQMNFYLNYCKDHEILEGENDPIGIILCAGKDQVMAKYAFGNFKNKIYASEYKLILPSPEELQREILSYKNHLVNVVQHKKEEVSIFHSQSNLSIYEKMLTPFKGITKKRGCRLLEHFRKHKKIRMPEYMRNNQISARTAHRDLAKFRNKEIIVFVGAKKTGHYELVKKYKEIFKKLHLVNSK